MRYPALYGPSTIDACRRAAELPVKLFDEHGREFAVRTWKPTLEHREPVTIECRLICVNVPDPSDDE